MENSFGIFYQTLVNLANLATQMVLDIGLGVATGGTMAIPAAIRTFGSSAEQAAANGAELNEQLLYAGTSAALSYGIEHVCNVAYSKLKIIAPGISDDLVTKSVEKLAQKLAKTPEGANALKNIGMVAASGFSEGREEILESLIDPVLQRLTYDRNAETVFQNSKLLADAFYESLIGGILGVFGGTASNAVDLVENMIYDGIMPGEKLMEAAGVSESEVLGAMALNDMAKMDNAVETGGTRPTWKQSELDAASDFLGYDAQRSFLKGERVPYGTKGSVRPDYYITGHSVDIKNYNLETESGRRNLARNVQQQYLHRIDNLPNQTAQSVMVDIRGQHITDTILNELYDDIMKRTDGNIEVLFKMN